MSTGSAMAKKNDSSSPGSHLSISLPDRRWHMWFPPTWILAFVLAWSYASLMPSASIVVIACVQWVLMSCKSCSSTDIYCLCLFLHSPHLIPLTWLSQLITCSWRLPKHDLHYRYATVFGRSIIMSQPCKKNGNQVTNVEGVKNGLTQGSKTTPMNPMS